MATTHSPQPPDGRLPRYQQIRDELMRRICARAWLAGEALPSEERLAAEFCASVGTIRKAMAALADDGIVERMHGSGTFVTRAFERISMLRFVDFSLAREHEVPQAETKAIRVRRASPEARRKLGLGAAAKVLYLHRTRSYAGAVLLSEHIVVAHAKFAGLAAYLRRNRPPMLYPVYDSVCGVLVSRAEDEITVRPLPGADAALFGQAGGTLGVRIERVMKDHGAMPIEWRVSWVAAERFHYVVEMR